MRMALQFIVLCFLVVPAGCSKPAGQTDERQALKPNETKADLVRLGPGSRAAAIRIAQEYMAGHHAELDISHRPPSADYFAQATHDGKPLWVIGFAVPVKLDATGRPVDGSFRRYYTFGLWIRENGNVETTFFMSP